MLWHMARPKKDPNLLKDEMLRIPVSAAEKQVIHEAAVAVDGEFARWARRILLREAQRYAASRSGGSQQKPRGRGNGRTRVA